MSFRNHITMAAIAAALAACSMEPAHADAFPPGFVPRHASFEASKRSIPQLRTDLPPVGSPALRGGAGPGLIYDTPRGWLPPGQRGGGLWAGKVSGYTIAVLPMSKWQGAPEDWNPPGLDRPPGDDGEPPTTPPPHPEPPSPPNENDVPGPLPLAGVAAAFGWARRLRRRLDK